MVVLSNTTIMVSPHQNLDNCCSVLFVAIMLVHVFPVLSFMLFQFTTCTPNNTPRHSELDIVLNRLLPVKKKKG